jgi:hypothetical protein
LQCFDWIKESNKDDFITGKSSSRSSEWCMVMHG